MEFELIEDISDDADDELDKGAVFFTRLIGGDYTIMGENRTRDDQAICIPEQEDG